MMLFASMVLERPLPTWQTLPAALIDWFQNAGSVSAVGIVLVLMGRYLQPESAAANVWTLPPALKPFASVIKICLALVALGYLLIGIMWIALWMNLRVGRLLPRPGPDRPYTEGDVILAVIGALALGIVLLPIVYDLATRISFGRIWAIALLSWKEAVRGRVIWVFGAMALIFLFAEWFLPYKPEDQIRNYVNVVYLSMTVLFLITAGLLGSFSIPNDVKNNSIHTIVTKPVEKFEIVLGRFLGYAVLLTIGLFIVSALSLVYVVRGVNEEAKHESYKARVPVYGRLHFAGTREGSQRGASVGREWAYRSYISGPTTRQRELTKQYAMWDFAEIPSSVIERNQPAIFELSFDIFRLSKGEEGKGIYCTFTFVGDPNFNAKGPEKQSLDMDARINEINQDGYQKVLEKHRIYQVRAIEVTDRHTQADVVVPPEVFKTLVGSGSEAKADDGTIQPALRVFVSVDQAKETQMVGVAPLDFYLLAHERDFWQNFLKGVIGMWCTHMLVLGIAVSLSTYFSGVISLLGTMYLYIAGLFSDYLVEIAEGRLDGGGPLEAGARLSGKAPIAGKLDASPATSLIQTIDTAFSWWIGRVLNLIPDINRHDMHQYVANGFDIGWSDVILLDSVLPMLGYLAPWAIVAYYLMKYREIANPS